MTTTAWGLTQGHAGVRPLTLLFTLAASTLAMPGAAQDRTVTLLQQLTDTPGPPGFEEPIRKVMVDAMKPLATSITFDGQAEPFPLICRLWRLGESPKLA